MRHNTNTKLSGEKGESSWRIYETCYRLMVQNGQVALLNGAAGSGNKPFDLAITANGYFLYALDPGSGNIDMFKIGQNGSLTNLGATDGELSRFAQCIAAR